MADSEQRLVTLPFLLLMVASFFGYGSFYMTLPVLPGHVLALGGGEGQIGLIIGVFSATALLVRPWSGWLSDRVGAAAVLMMGGAGMTLAAAAYMAADSVGTVLVVRILHGLAWGLFTASAATLAAQLAPADRRGAAMGLFGLSGSAGLALGPVSGTALGPAVFASSAVAAGLGLGLSICLAANRRRADRRGGEAVVAGVQGAPVLSELISRPALLPAGVMLAHMCTYGAVVSFMPLLTDQRSLGGSGWFFSTYAVALFVFRSYAGHLSDRFGRLAVIGPGLLLGAAALTLMSLAATPVTLGVAAVIYAGAMAAIQPVALAWATDRAEPGRRGAAVSTVIATQDLGISSGSLLAGLAAGQFGLTALFAGAAAVALAGIGPVILTARRGRAAGAEGSSGKPAGPDGRAADQAGK